MRRFVFLMIVVVAAWQPVLAGHHDQLLQDLLNIGAQAMQRAAVPTETPAADAAAIPADTASSEPQDLVGAVLSRVQEEGSIYIENLEKEGKKYAQELGKTVVREIKKDAEVEQTLFSVRALCWGVVIYISIISLLIFFMLRRVMRLLEKQLREKC